MICFSDIDISAVSEHSKTSKRRAYRLSDCRLADLIGFIKDFPMKVIQDGGRVPDTDKVDHGFDVPEGDQTARH